MRTWDTERIARATGATVLRERQPGPERAGIDSRLSGPGELFFGLPGERQDGGLHAGEALAAGAWGVLAAPEHAARAAAEHDEGAVLAHPDPLQALQRLAAAWRGELQAAGAHVLAITGSTGKTSTKDILAALLAGELRTAASPQNLNTEIGLPLAILAAPRGTQALVLEMAMRGPGQIAQLVEIARPEVGVIVNVGPAHLELLGSLEAIAAAKAELIAGLQPGATIVLPAGEALLEPHRREDLREVFFGEGADVRLISAEPGRVIVDRQGTRIELQPSFSQPHNVRNLLAAVAAAGAVGVTPSGRLRVEFSAMRGQRSELPGDVLLIDDCYNANPMSMRAAIDDLAGAPAGRRVAVLGDMLELGEQGPALHREIGRHLSERGIELLVAVGPLAAQTAEAFPGESRSYPDAQAAAGQLAGLIEPGDAVLVKGSRGVGLEAVSAALREAGGAWGVAKAAGSGRS